MAQSSKDPQLTQAEPPRAWALGRLELSVMESVWTWGESSVRDVVHRLERPLAYTTIMTTLDRLFKKGLLSRRKADRAFLYSAARTREEWQRGMASELLAGFLGGQEASRDLLISCLVDAVGQHDESLLKALEDKIREKRRESARQERP
jgi:predicted transcriptional regulator